jgi:hypothetical protein
MRLMEIPRFPRKIKIRDLDTLYRARLSRTVVMWPDQAIPLLGYMCYPNNLEAREILLRTIRSWAKESEATPPTVPRGLGRIQNEWQHVADIFHLYCDLIKGQHQARRGGPSIGKAITLAEANTKSRGTGAATLWKNWSTYKDVAHLVTATTLICAEARARFRDKPPGLIGLSLGQFIPFQMAMLMPDLVLAVGLSVVPRPRTEPALEPETLWRIPPNMNVAPIPPPIRKIRAQDLVVLNNRRAGNRGKANVRKKIRVSKTTLISGSPSQLPSGFLKSAYGQSIQSMYKSRSSAG